MCKKKRYLLYFYENANHNRNVNVSLQVSRENFSQRQNQKSNKTDESTQTDILFLQEDVVKFVVSIRSRV